MRDGFETLDCTINATRVSFQGFMKSFLRVIHCLCKNHEGGGLCCLNRAISLLSVAKAATDL